MNRASSSSSGIVVPGAESTSGEDSKPNNLGGGSVRDQRVAAGATVLEEDLSPLGRAADCVGEDCSVSDLEFGPDSGFGGEDEYVLEPPYASVGGEALLAECSVERAANRRRENYYFTMGKKVGAIHGIALKSASDLLGEIFPEGVPSQGVLKSGVQCIDADVMFTAVGCDRPWHGFIIDDVLYMYVSEFLGSEGHFRQAVMALMELAEDVLLCSSVVVALPRALQALPPQQQALLSPLDADAAASLVRAFLYSGFELISPMLYCPNPSYILVGYDAM
ncbi:hypothetical protein GGF46_001816 [Coemansia sp. RSA 552]|nr:hypothetical protein GGF46_001816 [Coemansia sp. RSA 552]